MCDIYKHGLLLTARKQFDLDSTVLELQGNNYAKHMWKVVLNWKASNRIEEVDWLSISSDFASHRKCLVACQDEIKKKKPLEIANL